MPIEFVSGDLFANAHDVEAFAHGCNCLHVMGAGLAAQVRRQFPEAYAADLATPLGDSAKLGTCSFAVVCTGTTELHVVNAYTQLGFGGDRVHVDYEAVRRCMAWLRCGYAGRRIGLPQIGAGLGGGDWVRIRRIIREELRDQDVTIVQFAGAP